LINNPLRFRPVPWLSLCTIAREDYGIHRTTRNKTKPQKDYKGEWRKPRVVGDSGRSTRSILAGQSSVDGADLAVGEIVAE